MENTAQETPAPEKSEKETSLESIVALRQKIKDSYISIRTVGILVAVASFAFFMLAAYDWSSPYMLPVLMTVVVGNQVYIGRTRKREKKLEELRTNHESKFGAIPMA